MGHTFFGVGFIVVVVVMGLLYFAPSIISIFRRKTDTVAILTLNFFLGWTFVGWIIALVWSLTKDKDNKQYIVDKPNQDAADQIEKFAKLKKEGLISEEEFEKKKAQILDEK
jgi:hypothetical protein